MILKDNHICLTSCNEITEICKPLSESLGINYFRFLRIYKDQSRICLSTNPDWTYHFFKRKFYNTAWFDRHPISHYQSGTRVWNDLATRDDNEVGTDSRTYYNMHHGFTLISKKENYCDFFDFTTTADNHYINEVYDKEKILFRKFSFYFIEQSINIIKKAKTNKIIMPDLANTKIISSEAKEKLKNIEIKRFYINDNTYLTKRELSVIYEFSNGLSAKKIAQLFRISPRTIEVHIENAKKKLACKNTIELVCICMKAGLFDALNNINA